VLRATGRSDREHVGENVLSHFCDLGTLEELNQLPLVAKMNKILTAIAKATLACEVHRHECSLDYIDVDVSGFPCTDWSPSGSQQGVHGPTFVVLLALVSWYRQSRPRIVFLENVPEFDVNVLEALLSDLYELHCFYLQPSDIACEHLSRMRLFVVCLLRGRLV
jgi:site-specific DNA-cytosine methylase